MYTYQGVISMGVMSGGKYPKGYWLGGNGWGVVSGGNVLDPVCDLSPKGEGVEYVNTCMQELFIML